MKDDARYVCSGFLSIGVGKSKATHAEVGLASAKGENQPTKEKGNCSLRAAQAAVAFVI